MNTVVTVPSRLHYGETLARLKAAIHDAGATLFAEIDQQAAAVGAGLDLRPTTLLLFGNPRAGTPLMDAWPISGLELPLRMLVWEQDGVVQVAYPRMSIALAQLDVSVSRAESLDLFLDKLGTTVA